MDDELIKVIVIGNTLVGKTSFIHRYVNNGFRSDYKCTIGVDFAIKQVQTSTNKTVKVQIWDIAGQERYTYLTRAYYREARGCVLMFDVTNTDSFLNVRKWKTDLDSKIRGDSGSLLPCILVANKCDRNPVEIEDFEIQSLCEDLGFVGWTKTSVKEDLMIKETMTYLLDVITGVKAKPTSDVFTKSITLSNKQADDKKGKKCSC